MTAFTYRRMLCPKYLKVLQAVQLLNGVEVGRMGPSEAGEAACEESGLKGSIIELDIVDGEVEGADAIYRFTAGTWI